MKTHPALGRTTDERALLALPSSSAAAGSVSLVSLPELPHFAGPTNQLVGATRLSAPLLVLGAYYSLAMHGLLSVPALVIAGSVGLVGMLSAHATLLSRRRRLLRTARALRAYAERTVGPKHELTERATHAVELLERDRAGSDPALTTDVEQGIGYTRELLLGSLRGVNERPGRGGEAQARRAAGGAGPL